MEKKEIISNDNVGTTTQIYSPEDVAELYKSKVNIECLYRETLNENNKLKEENRKNIKNKDARDMCWFGGSLISVLVAAFISFCVGSCMNGCAATEDRHIYQPAIVEGAAPYGSHSVEYSLGNGIVLIDQKGKFNIGDTIKFN